MMIVGIDLGTTNSAITVWLDGRPQLIPNSLGALLTPSAVSVDDDGHVLVGMAARERQVTHPRLTATAFKRWMGTGRMTSLGPNQTFSPEELSALVLRSLKADAEAFLREPVTEAVITVPAYFNDHQRKATRRAGELAGLKVERLLNEPTAAALAHGLHQRELDTQFLVFDLGGGTFDVSIVEIFEGIIEVRSSAGDNHLGGEDFNQVLVEDFYAALGSTLGPRFRDKQVLQERVREQAERARRELTRQPVGKMTVTWQERQLEHSIDAERFEKLCEPLLTRMREPVLRALRDGGIHADKLQEIVLVGGATRMPLVRRAVAKMFGRFPGMGPNPDEAIALGAAVQAGLKARDAAGIAASFKAHRISRTWRLLRRCDECGAPWSPTCRWVCGGFCSTRQRLRRPPAPCRSCLPGPSCPSSLGNRCCGPNFSTISPSGSGNECVRP
jgi:molecular chaperone HscC